MGNDFIYVGGVFREWKINTANIHPQKDASDLHVLFVSGASRMTFKMYAVDFCELLLFDEHKQAYHLVLHCFEKKKVLDAYIR